MLLHRPQRRELSVDLLRCRRERIAANRGNRIFPRLVRFLPAGLAQGGALAGLQVRALHISTLTLAPYPVRIRRILCRVKTVAARNREPM